MVDDELCRKMARSFHRTTKMEYEDLLQEAYWVWYHAVEGNKKYDPNKASIKTFAVWCIRSHFLTLAGKHRKRPQVVELDLETPSTEVSAEQVLDWQDRIRSLTSEAQLAVQLVFEAPYELLAIGAGIPARNKIVQLLVEKHALPERVARDAVREVRTLFAV
jgi:RNA polymerase sigma factor (sigma-70 family)